MDTDMIDKAVGKLVRMGAQVSADEGKITDVFFSETKLSDSDLVPCGGGG